VLVTQNTVSGNGRSGVIVGGDGSYASANNVVADNILAWNGMGQGGGYGLRTYWESAGAGSGNQAVRNLIYGNASGDVWIAGGGLSVVSSIIQDPLFVNRAAGDFHLALTSPAVDSASTPYSTASDFAGTARPQGAGPDIGAFER
jgi:hypothetical protein